jgi:hypothetical protein
MESIDKLVSHKKFLETEIDIVIHLPGLYTYTFILDSIKKYYFNTENKEFEHNFGKLISMFCADEEFTNKLKHDDDFVYYIQCIYTYVLEIKEINLKL